MNLASSLDALEVAYARFNAIKTLTTSEPSKFETTRFGQLDVTRDAAREDFYYHRVLGFPSDSLVDLDAAIEWIRHDASASRGVRLDTPIGHGQEIELARRGLEHTDTLVWLSLGSRSLLDTEQTTSPRNPADGLCRELTVDDWPALRQLLNLDWPTDPQRWLEKRSHFCTDTFRWVGVFNPTSPVSDATFLVSAASMWISGQVAILGSAYTQESSRGRGHQRSLLDRRIALWSGPLLVDVEPLSTSYRNCVRAGFGLLEEREVWTTQA